MTPFVSLLKIINDPTHGAGPSPRAIVTASDAIFEKAFQNINVIIDLTVIGAGGIDIGPVARNATYYLFLITDGMAVSGLASLSFDNPALPQGFVEFVRIAAWPTGGAGNWFKMITAGKRTHALLHMYLFEGRFSFLKPCGNPNPQQFAAIRLTGVPKTAQWALGHTLLTSNNNFLLVAVDPLNHANNVAIIQYSGGSEGLSLRLYWEYPLSVPQTLFLYSTQSAGTVVSGWIDSTNVT